jgi:hypothetical protein
VDGGTGGPWTSASTTLLEGASGPDACVPVQSQLSPESGQAYFPPATSSPAVQGLLTASAASSLGACLGACPPGGCCWAQWDAQAKTCRVATLAAASPGATSGKQLMYKLPPSVLGSASSVAAKTLASGYYAVGAIPAASEAAWQAVGSNLVPTDARTFAAGGPVWTAPAVGPRACQEVCDLSNVCWGFVHDAATGACLFRGGVDSLATRAFFVLPGNSVVAAANWASRGVNGTSNSTASVNGTSNSTANGTSSPVPPAPTCPLGYTMLPNGTCYCELTNLQLVGCVGAPTQHCQPGPA